METRAFTEDTVALKQDPSIIAIVEIDSLGFSKPDDWIEHTGIQREKFQNCLLEGQPPHGHVIIRFTEPYAGCTLVKESDLIIKDRGLVVGDVVKKSPTDIGSGYVIKTSTLATLQPFYTELPWNNSEPWPYKEEDNLLTVPAEELTFSDLQTGDLIMYKRWVGEVADYHEEVTVKLSDGSVVRVDKPDDLEVVTAEISIDSNTRGNLITMLHESRKTSEERTRYTGYLCPGQIVHTKKANLRLGHWIIGRYNPSIQPRGIVVEIRVTEILCNWLTSNVYHPGNRSNMLPGAPPESLSTDELVDVILYNRNNVSSGATSDDYGSRRNHDIGAGDFCRLRDVAGAAVKYSESSPNVSTTGIFRRIPRTATLGFDMNTFNVRTTTLTASVQWQDGSVTHQPATDLIPYLNVDDHDLWVGEICSLKSAEVKSDEDGLLKLKKVGVIQAVDAKERTATIRWFKDPQVAVFQDRTTFMEPGSKLGELEDQEHQVSVYEVMAYPALTKRRGDLVLIAPNEEVHALHHASSLYSSMGGHLASVQNLLNMVGQNLAATNNIEDVLRDNATSEWRWFGEVVDLGKDGLLTVRLGGLDTVEDIKVPVTRLTVVVGGDDDDDMSAGSIFDEDSDMSDDLDDYDSSVGLPSPLAVEEIIYEGGQRIDNDEDSDAWGTDEDGDSEEQANGAVANSSVELPIPKQPTQASASEDVAMEDTPVISAPSLPIPNSQTKNHKDYDFNSLPNMPDQFQILDDGPAPDHHYLSKRPKLSAALLRRIRKEHSILQGSLPAGIWVRTWADRMDLLRILIVGPRGTPYELAPFVMDFQFRDDFPSSPPDVYFHSWTNSIGRINPNLYEDGKVCLSVLGTWPENGKNEGWNKDKSSILQVLVSLMGLVLVEQPFYNEAGFEALVGTEETLYPSRVYSEKAYCMAKGFIAHALGHTIAALDSIIQWLYLDNQGPGLLRQAVEESEAKMARETDDDERLSAGAAILIKRHLEFLSKKLQDIESIR